MTVADRIRAKILPALFACLVVFPLGEARAQLSAEVPGSELTVYLMTMGPGEMVWERFGHNAIRIRDELRETDIAYNYGMFSFDQENFILRFIRGEMDYWMEGWDARWMADAYVRSGRSVWMQELNLTPEQRVQLRDFLEWNALPENRVYRYDYYRDNCSTRVRDAIDLVLGGTIREQTEGRPSGTTYRAHTRSLTAVDPPIYAGLMLGLGPMVDRPISVWEEMFLPMRFMEHVRGIQVADGARGTVPLVAAEYEIFDSGRPEATLPPSRTLPVALVGIVIAGLMVFAASRSRRSLGARIAFGSLAGGWALIAGLLGVVLLGLWAFTSHEAAYRNENLLQVSPLLLPLVVLIPLLRRVPPPVARIARWIAIVVAAGSVIGLLLQPLPAFPQVNGEVIAFTLPMNLGLAIALWLRGSDGVGRAEARAPVAAERPRAARAA